MDLAEDIVDMDPAGDIVDRDLVGDIVDMAAGAIAAGRDCPGEGGSVQVYSCASSRRLEQGNRQSHHRRCRGSRARLCGQRNHPQHHRQGHRPDHAHHPGPQGRSVAAARWGIAGIEAEGVDSEALGTVAGMIAASRWKIGDIETEGADSVALGTVAGMIADTLEEGPGEGPGEVEAQSSHTHVEGEFHSTLNSLLLGIEEVQGRMLKSNKC